MVADLRAGDDVAAQTAALSRRTRTVTLTVGGNDILFAPVLATCTYTPVPALQGVVLGRPGCREKLEPLVAGATAGLAGKVPTGPGRVSLATVLAEVHRKAPRAKVYVTGYPRLFGLTGFDAYGCRVGSVAGAPLYVSSADVRWVRAKADGLNAALRAGVAQARTLGVPATYVDVADAFTSHNVCGSGTPVAQRGAARPDGAALAGPGHLPPERGGAEGLRQGRHRGRAGAPAHLSAPPPSARRRRDRPDGPARSLARSRRGTADGGVARPR